MGQTSEYQDNYEGFHRVTGYVKDCKWPLVLKSAQGFAFAQNEKIKQVPLVSYELREALRSGEIELDEVEDWFWVPSEDSIDRRGLRASGSVFGISTRYKDVSSRAGL